MLSSNKIVDSFLTFVFAKITFRQVLLQRSRNDLALKSPIYIGLFFDYNKPKKI